MLLSILESAAGTTGRTTPGGTAFPSGRPFPPGCFVKFAESSTAVVQRAGMWEEGAEVRLGVWPGELKPQYTRLYSEMAAVEQVIEAAEESNWRIETNFHIAYRLASPTMRWYPRRTLTAPVYLRQWVGDFKAGRAGGRTRAQLDDPATRHWLVDSQYASEEELPTLDSWLDSVSPNIQFHIRPGIELTRSWPVGEAQSIEERTAFVADVRATINDFLIALGQPSLGQSTPDEATSETRPRPSAAMSQYDTAGVCTDCNMVHPGDCY